MCGGLVSWVSCWLLYQHCSLPFRALTNRRATQIPSRPGWRRTAASPQPPSSTRVRCPPSDRSTSGTGGPPTADTRLSRPVRLDRHEPKTERPHAKVGHRDRASAGIDQLHDQLNATRSASRSVIAATQCKPDGSRTGRTEDAADTDTDACGNQHHQGSDQHETLPRPKPTARRRLDHVCAACAGLSLFHR